MSTTRKLTLIIIILLGFSLAAIFSLYMLNKRNTQHFKEYSREQVFEAASSIADIYEVQMYWVAYDYTLWDALIDYIEEPDSAWAHENFEQFLYWFDLEGFWIFDTEGRVVLSDTSECASALPLTEFNDELLAKLHKERMLDYYTTANDTLMLLQGATIHPTVDEERESEPAGYFFIAKCWDEGITDLAESLTGCDLTHIVNRPGLNIPSETDYRKLAIPYKDLDDNVVAWLVFTKRIDFVELLRKNSLHILLLIIMTFLVTYVVLSLAFKKLVINPLILIKKIISDDNTAPIPKLKRASTDFEQIGNLIESFILQKEELKHQRDKAEESDRLKSAFLANMSHEIRTPMNGILGFAELLKSQDLNSDQQEKYISIIEKSGHRMLHLINSIMDISRIESGQIEVDTCEVDISEELKTLYEIYLIRFKNQNKDVYLTLELTDDKRVIHTDQQLFQSVISNLLDNALKFTHKGEVAFGYTLTDHGMKFFVRDSGVGIPEGKIPFLFERFYQTDMRLNRSYEGAGLGLSIAKGFVELLGGTIWVESELGRGSTFYFKISDSKPTEQANQ
jgi:signal transduction histidine kinase